MTKLLSALTLVASLALTLHASEQAVAPVGYFIDTIASTDADAEAVKAHARFLRDGQEYDAVQGMEVYPGDTILTTAGGGIAVGFLNSSVIELAGDTKLSVIGGGGSAKETGNVVLNQGHIGVSTQSYLNDGLNIGMGDTRMPFARAATVKPAKLDIIILPTSTPGAYNTTVYCTAGVATLTPNGASKVDITSGVQALLTVPAPVTGVTNAPVTITTSTVGGTKDDLKLGKASLKAAASGTEITVSVGKTSIAFKSTIKNTDGSKTTGSFTTSLTGIVTKDAWKTASAKGAPKFSESWSENGAKISVKQSFTSGTNVVSFSGALVNDTTSKASLKIGKVAYVGTATYDPLTGKITFTGAPKAGGSTATFTFDPNTAGGPTQSVVVTTGSVVGTPITHQEPVGPPSASTPGGRVIGQNQPPVSQ